MWSVLPSNHELNLPGKLADYWQGVLGSNSKGKNYFQRYLLAEISSPLVLGLAIELPELNLSQVQDLVQRHALNWPGQEVERLMQMVGGPPYLVRVALYQIALGRMTLPLSKVTIIGIT